MHWKGLNVNREKYTELRVCIFGCKKIKMLQLPVLVILLVYFVEIGQAARAQCTRPANAFTKIYRENQPTGDEVYFYQGSDSDGDPITFYSIGSIAPFRFFGASLRLNGPLDFESVDRILLNNIYARDPTTAASNGDLCKTITIIVTPVNEFQPEFNPTTQTVTIPEGSPQDMIIAGLTCTDRDKEPSGKPEGCSLVTIQSGDDVDQKFKINAALNEIQTTTNVIDYDTGDVTYTLIVIGEDSSTLDPHKTVTTTITVNIEPVNEFTPQIIVQPLTLTIPEDTPVGTEVLSVTTTDDDGGRHGEVTYTVIAGNTNNTLLISQSTGKIYLRNPVDYESASAPTFSLTIEAKDGGGLSTTAVIDVTITDVNDNIPICSSKEYNVSVSEDVVIGTTILSIICSDRDAGTTLTYSILDGDFGLFQISPSGDIQTTSGLDYDSGTFIYYMSIQISDGIHNTKIWVLVRLRPVNEFDPTFTNPTINVDEIEKIGYEVMTYTADDGDAPPHDVTSYQILNVLNGNMTTFYMEKTSGKIYLAQILDFESIPQYKIIVMATDGGGRTGTGTITINVQNGNDHAPTCVTSVESFTLSENAALGYVLIPDFGCSDLDNDPLTYAITQIPTDNTFEVDNISNQLRVKGALDYERYSFYSITIIVSDGSSSARLKIAVNIKNENEDAPQFLNPVINTVVSEADMNGKSVATVSAVDADSDPVKYYFLGTYPNFRIDSKTGKILLRTSIDRETDPTIDIYVIASDGQRSSTATVSVTVDDVNETPIFVNSSYRFAVAENTITGTDIGTVLAVDADVGPVNGQIRYKILSGNDKSYFQIDSINGRITVATPIDYEDMETALLVIEASDLGTPTLSGMCTVSIKIVDRNDNAPQFLSSTLQEQVPEDTPLGQSISQVFAFDKDSSTDENNKVNYQSSSVVPFQVDSDSGIVAVTGSLDRESIPGYQMIIIATDRGTPRLTGTLTLDISLTDVNDNDPVVTGIYSTTVPENAPEHFVIFDIHADDADGEAFGKLKYEIISGDSNSAFKIEPNTGVIQVASPLDRESISRYELVIKVTDNGIPPRSTTGTATITIGDVNDVAPVSLNSSYQFSVLENITLHSHVGKILASDGDFGINSQLKYKISTYWSGSNGKFEIDEMSGDIYTTGLLDREVEDVYSILFRVEDEGTPTLLSDIIVNINIEDINDKQPMFRRPEYSTAIFENLAVGSKVLTTGATDQDLGVNAVIKYELDISTQNGLLTNYYFSVHESTGDIYLKRKVDREAYEMFTLTIVAKDTGVPPLSSSVSVNIKIEDINDNRPKFSPLFYNTEASITNICDATITVVTATDVDLGRNAAVNYGFDENDVSLPFTVSQLGVVKARSELLLTKYVINVISRDNGDPVLTSSDHATVRIDIFRPEDVVVTFHLDMTLSTFYQKEANLLRQVEEALSVDFPTVYVRRWCVEVKTTSLLVYLYAVKNDATNDISNLNVRKIFLTNGEFIDALQLNSNKRPTVEVNGKTWNEYAIEEVVPYGDKIVHPEPLVSHLEEDTEYIVPLAVSISLLMAAFIIAAIFVYLVWRRRWRRKKQKRDDSKKPRVELIETKQKGKNIPLFEKRGQSQVSRKPTSGCDRSNSAVSVVSPVPQKINEEPVKEPDVELENSENVNTRQISGPYIKVPPTERPAFDTTSKDGSLKSDVGNGIVEPEHPEKIPVRRGIEIVTGWVYEEDPQTKVRNWIHTPIGEESSSFLPFNN